MIEFLITFGFKAFFAIFGIVIIGYILLFALGGIAMLFESSSPTQTKIHVKEEKKRSLRKEININRILQLLAISIGAASLTVIIAVLSQN